MIKISLRQVHSASRLDTAISYLVYIIIQIIDNNGIIKVASLTEIMAKTFDSNKAVPLLRLF